LYSCVCFACLCPMIDVLRVNVVRGSRAWKSMSMKNSEQLLYG
jgi:hypothetical protein